MNKVLEIKQYTVSCLYCLFLLIFPLLQLNLHPRASSALVELVVDFSALFSPDIRKHVILSSGHSDWVFLLSLFVLCLCAPLDGPGETGSGS